MRYEKSTDGIRVRVEPRYSLADSDPAVGTFVFSYQIEMANEGPAPARLLFRHWRIHDSAGEDTEVEGEGVVGEQPHLEPGGEHRYRSFCVLRSPAGFMEGYYTFERSTGERFRVAVPRFQLSAPFMTLPEEGSDEVMN
ncbi:MAG TPA: Co2+/Mg2+ efflux protein ApaG [Longimicrobiales bacterium]|nr:Co2+/Mg2+ efflux protein ApaG [Longimicrobiales bacterium]